MTHDLVGGVGVAAAWASMVGLVGFGLALVARQRSLQWRLATVAVIAVSSLTVGMVAGARMVLVSAHDFRVVVSLAVPAGLVSTLLALVTARQTVRRLRPPVVSVERCPEAAPAFEGQEWLDTSWRVQVARATHDLRPPLAALRAMAEALEHDRVDNPGPCHAQMRETIAGLTQTVERLFDVTVPTCDSAVPSPNERVAAQ